MVILDGGGPALKKTGAIIVLLLLAAIAAGLAFVGGKPDANQITTIGDAKLADDGTLVSLTGKIATSCAADFTAMLPQFSSGTQVGTVQSTAINEASGLVASRANSDVLWVHNDSGDSARVFAMTTAGELLAIYNLLGATAWDWEDMCIGPGPTAGQDYLYLGDIGDNSAGRSSIRVYRVAEPTVSASATPINLSGVETFTLQYEDGARDAETLMVDPANGDLYVVSKRDYPSRVYRVEAGDLTTTGTITLQFMTQLPWRLATGGDISPQGDEIIIRSSGSASLWQRPHGTDLWDAFSGTEYSVPLRYEIQGESIAYDGEGGGYYTVSEGTNPPIYYFDRTPAAAPEFFYIEEPGRSSGIRVNAATGSITGLVRGSVVNVEGELGTNSADERQIVDATVEVTAEPASPLGPVHINNRDLGGADFGTPPAGQYGISGGHGLNSVGLLIKTSGEVTSINTLQNYVEISDGSDSSIRIDTTAVRTTLNQGDHISVAGILRLDKPDTDRIPYLTPRSDLDVIHN